MPSACVEQRREVIGDAGVGNDQVSRPVFVVGVMVARPRVNDLIGLTHSDSNRVARPEGKRRMKVPSPLPSSTETLSKQSLVTARSRDAVAIKSPRPEDCRLPCHVSERAGSPTELSAAGN